MQAAQLFLLTILAFALCGGVPLDHSTETKLLVPQKESTGWSLVKSPMEGSEGKIIHFTAAKAGGVPHEDNSTLTNSKPFVPPESKAWHYGRRALHQVSVGNILGLVGPFPQGGDHSGTVAWYKKVRCFSHDLKDSIQVDGPGDAVMRDVSGVLSVSYDLGKDCEIFLQKTTPPPIHIKGKEGCINANFIHVQIQCF